VVATEFRLIPFGLVEVLDAQSGESFNFTRAHAEQALAWFKKMGRALQVDYEHQSLGRFNTRPDGLMPAAGWIGGLQVRADGLWATDVEWTELAAGLLARGEYRYFSPVICWTDQKHTSLKSLGPVALTNDPAMCGAHALAANCQIEIPEGVISILGAYAFRTSSVVVAQGGARMHQIAMALGLEPTASVEKILQVIDALKKRAARGGGEVTGADEQDWRGEYRRSHSLQQEFGDEEVYVAFMKADQAGLVNILSR
jgi:hypothetical protein